MAKILPDREVKQLIGTVIREGDCEFLNPNGIELRLGADVRFLSTGEEKALGKGRFLKVTPGETVLISSMEELDFTQETVEALFPGRMIMGIITPTTTMMREGISQVATKIDAGFRGTLNWSLRNGSTKDLIVQFGEPIFKLTLFLLDEDEKPDLAYGARQGDRYQDTEGIARSRRSIPVDIPKKSLVASSVEKLDPTKRLQEAGYPFNHIGTELITLHGKFEAVSTGVTALREEFEKLDTRLSGKIEHETKSLLDRINETSKSLLDKVEILFRDRMLSMCASVVGIATLGIGAYKALLSSQPNSTQVSVLFVVAMLAFVVAVAGPRMYKR